MSEDAKALQGRFALLLRAMPFTITMDGPHGQRSVFSESENAQRTGFWHVITEFNGSRFNTHFTEYLYRTDGPNRAWVIRHPASVLPPALQVHAFHEHVLAKKQMLFRQQPMHYVAHVAISVADQLAQAARSWLFKR